jgi:hypothetical protein
MLPTLLEKLQLKDEKNLLIQGLPSSIEKQFSKLTFAKNVTPLMRIKKIDFALVFAVNENQLSAIINEVLPAMRSDGKFWVAYPKLTSKIATTLNRDQGWICITRCGYEGGRQIAIDHVWTALRFKKREHGNSLFKVSVNSGRPVSDREISAFQAPEDFTTELRRSKIAAHFFEKLPSSNKKEYVSWIGKAKRKETRSRRLEAAIDKLIAGKQTPSEV